MARMMGIKCADCPSKNMLCPAMFLPTSYVANLIRGNENDLKMGAEIIRGNIFVLNCPARHSLRFVFSNGGGR